MSQYNNDNEYDDSAQYDQTSYDTHEPLGDDEEGRNQLDNEEGGEYHYEYNGDGEREQESNAQQSSTSIQEDALISRLREIVTEEDVAQWKEVFSLFDYDESGYVRTEELGAVLRGLGWNVTEQEITNFVNTYDKAGEGKLDFRIFCWLIVDHWPLRGACTEQQVLSHFPVFDISNRDGYISAADLVSLLRDRGEPLTQDDVDHLLQEITIDGDSRIKITDFVQHMFRSSVP